MEEFIKLVPVFLISMAKFLFGPPLGVTLKLGFWATFVACMGGMMTSVVVLSYLGSYLKLFLLRLKKKSTKLFTPSNRRIVTIWTKFGLIGIAFLTPPLLTPIGGTLIAVGFGEPPFKIILYMLISGLAWGLAACYVVFQLKGLLNIF